MITITIATIYIYLLIKVCRGNDYIHVPADNQKNGSTNWEILSTTMIIKGESVTAWGESLTAWGEETLSAWQCCMHVDSKSLINNGWYNTHVSVKIYLLCLQIEFYTFSHLFYISTSLIGGSWYTVTLQHKHEVNIGYNIL